MREAVDGSKTKFKVSSFQRIKYHSIWTSFGHLNVSSKSIQVSLNQLLDGVLSLRGLRVLGLYLVVCLIQVKL